MTHHPNQKIQNHHQEKSRQDSRNRICQLGPIRKSPRISMGILQDRRRAQEEILAEPPGNPAENASNQE